MSDGVGPTDLDNARRIVINEVPIEWNAARNRFTFFGIEGIIFWKNPSLLSILRPLREQLGEELFSLLIAYEVSRGTYEDYYQMVEHLGASFEEGFVNWGRAVGGAGWGRFDLQSIDWSERRARVRVDRPWELSLFRPTNPQHAIPFINGKLSGIFSWAFDCLCRASVDECDDSETGYALVTLAPSTMTLERELEQVQQRHGLNDTEHLQISNRQLRTHLDRFFEVVEAAGEFVCELDRQFRIVFATRTLSTTLGVEHEILDGRDLRDYLSDDGRAVLATWLGQEDTTGAGELEVGAWTAAGEHRWLALGITPMTDMRGATLGYRFAGRDVTVTRHTQQELRLMAAAFQSSQAVVITDGHGQIERINEAFEAISGYGDQDVTGQDLGLLGADPSAAETIRTALANAYRNGTWEGEIAYRHRDGTGYPVWQSITACRDRQGCLEHMVAVFHDISPQKDLECRLQWQATHDHLTGLANRVLLERTFAQEVDRARRYERPLALLLFDLDHFKQINDEHGHAAGDEVLKGIAERLLDSVRPSDLVARWGGEEFMLLAPETGGAAALKLAHKLRGLIREPAFAQVGRITVSIGVAELTGADTCQTLFQRLDRALYAAKAAGRDCYRQA